MKILLALVSAALLGGCGTVATAPPVPTWTSVVVEAPEDYSHPTFRPTPAPETITVTTIPKPSPTATPTPKPTAAKPVPKPTTTTAKPPVEPSGRPTSYRGVPISNTDPDGYPGGWGAANCQIIYIYPATPDKYVVSVIKHEYIHVLQCRDGVPYNERVADAGEALLGGSYFHYTNGNPTAAETAEAKRLLGL